MRVAFVLLCLVLATLPVLAEERLLIKSAKLGIQAYYDKSSGWCGAEVKLKLRAFESETFQEAPEAVQRLIGGARAALTADCPLVSALFIDGEVAGKVVWQAVCTQSENWRVNVTQRSRP